MPPIHDPACATAADMLFVTRLVALACVLLILNLIGHALIFLRTLTVYSRVDTLLTMTEEHGANTDRRAEQIEHNTQTVATVVAPLLKAAPLLQAASEDVKREIKDMPEKVASAIKKGTGSSDGGDIQGSIPTIP